MDGNKETIAGKNSTHHATMYIISPKETPGERAGVRVKFRTNNIYFLRFNTAQEPTRVDEVVLPANEVITCMSLSHDGSILATGSSSTGFR